MKITIFDILEWDEDKAAGASIYSHEGEMEYQRCLESERSEKLDKEWTKGLTLPKIINLGNGSGTGEGTVESIKTFLDVKTLNALDGVK